MSTFTAATGREWEVELRLGDLPGLRTCGFDLNELARTDGGFATWMLAEDKNQLLASVWRLIRGQASSPELEVFFEELDAEAVRRLRNAFATAVVEFFPEREASDVAAEKKTIPPREEAEMQGQWVERLGWELAGLVGVDGSRLTLRQLTWMAREHRRFSGELWAWHAAKIIAHIPFGAASLDPEKINPYRIAKPKSASLIELEKWQAEMSWKCRLGLA